MDLAVLRGSDLVDELHGLFDRLVEPIHNPDVLRNTIYGVYARMCDGMHQGVRQHMIARRAVGYGRGGDFRDAQSNEIIIDTVQGSQPAFDVPVVRHKLSERRQKAPGVVVDECHHVAGPGF